MNDRLGIVTLEHDGVEVPLRFTWRAIDSLGRDGVTIRLSKADSGEPGDVAALAELLEAASGGALTIKALLEDPPPFMEALTAVAEAWMLALHGPARKPRDRPPDPLNRLRTWSSTLWRRLTRSTSTTPGSGTPRPI